MSVFNRRLFTLPLAPCVRAYDHAAAGSGIGRDLHLGARTVVMGVLNITPDSFSDGGVRFDRGRAIEDGLRMFEDGAHILDVGGESTRPGAEPLTASEELRRVLPVVEALAAKPDALVSIDTYKATVAKEALAAGAAVVNDISGLGFDHDMGRVAAEAGAAVILMHMRGSPRDMYREARYADVLTELSAELQAAAARATAAGIHRESIVLDPGIGFAKHAEHSYAALAGLPRLAELGYPLLVGASRKSFMKEALGGAPPAERDWGTAAAVTASVLFGAHIVRVHAVKEMAQVVRVADRIREGAWHPAGGGVPAS